MEHEACTVVPSRSVGIALNDEEDEVGGRNTLALTKSPFPSDARKSSHTIRGVPVGAGGMPEEEERQPTKGCIHSPLFSTTSMSTSGGSGGELVGGGGGTRAMHATCDQHGHARSSLGCSRTAGGSGVTEDVGLRQLHQGDLKPALDCCAAYRRRGILRAGLAAPSDHGSPPGRCQGSCELGPDGGERPRRCRGGPGPPPSLSPWSGGGERPGPSSGPLSQPGAFGNALSQKQISDVLLATWW